MKKILLTAAVIFIQLAYSQGEKREKAFFFEPLFRVSGIVPVNFGDNYLAEANKSKLSAGFNMSMFEYHQFRVAVGFDHLFYEVTDVQKAAIVQRSYYGSVYAQLSYEIPVAGPFSVQPYVGIGYGELNFKKHGSHINDQKGNNYRAGMYLDYRFSKVFSIFGGANYVYSSYEIHTNPEFKSFFDHSKAVQLSLGIKVGYSLKSKAINNQ